MAKRKPAKARQTATAPSRLFKDQAAWAEWLASNHAKSSGLWLCVAKKDSGLKSVSYAEALESALCYGWIDGQKRPKDDRTWLQHFVPRADKSLWSKINREKALALIKSGRMQSAGYAAIERAKANRRWDSAYESPSRSTIPEDLAAALAASPRANEFFQTLNSANRYAILFRVQTVKKAETRIRKIAQFIAMLEKHEKLHP